ncbi:hypothetical protein [Natranaerofaba carboxydovora]|uniref:hypothetical protein n=1 Tax=Natranaerofaba carboxydovora TaxID=2742683 RepID=UPI001F14348B|nr:hypothetical protein [Natranaerofaba carboxydovora]UMZ73526.1 hypothetical protein ACONDI_01080 [Natranaerofaba carboxydovora]UMZ75196.1 hypothetical protein ACONDI_02811 [Natranaerofaba carboxydovora]
MGIRFLKPRKKNTTKVELELPNHLVKLLELYANYCNRSRDEIVEHYLEEILKEDKDFIQWGKNRRHNKLFKKYIEEVSTSNTDNITILKEEKEEDKA